MHFQTILITIVTIVVNIQSFLVNRVICETTVLQRLELSMLPFGWPPARRLFDTYSPSLYSENPISTSKPYSSCQIPWIHSQELLQYVTASFNMDWVEEEPKLLQVCQLSLFRN